MEEYKEYVSARLSHLSPFMQSYALGDFSEPLEIPEEEDEFTELFVGLTLMVDDIKEMIQEKEDTISRLKLTEEALRASEEKYHGMIKNLSEGFYSATPDGTLLDHNIEFNRILGFGLDEDLVGIQLPDFWQNPEDREAYLEEFSKHGSVKNYLIAAGKKDGEKIFVEANSRLIKDEQGKPTRLEGTFIEVTDRVQAQQELRQRVEELARANAELEQFNRLAVGREMRMIELKRQVNELAQEMGREPPHDLSFLRE
jgi:PAS domain S-box-containing protein